MKGKLFLQIFVIFDSETQEFKNLRRIDKTC